MADIVRILQDIAVDNDMIYHYGKKSVLNLIDGNVDPGKIYFLHEFTNRRAEYSTSGTKIAANIYEGKFFLVKHSDLDQNMFNEVGEESESKYTVNIEPLLTQFANVGNDLGCTDYEVQQWDNIDVTDVLDANMDGLLCSYRIRIEV